MTKVRFAPSPTGKLHVGNVRTAIFNYLFARKAGGQFLLRIDDTDTERSTKAYEEGIRTDLTWLGIHWDDTFRQSERFDVYGKAAETLKAKGEAAVTGGQLGLADHQRRQSGSGQVQQRSE